MFASLHISRPALQALLVEQPDKRYQPVVVLDEPQKTTTSKLDRGKLRVLEISSEAEEFGIHRGMTAVQAQARCDYLILLNRSAKAETSLTTTLLDLAEQFTPDFEDTACGTCLLDLGGVAGVESDALTIAHQLHESLQAKNYIAHIGLAPNPDLAFLASRAMDSLSVSDQGDVLVIHDSEIESILSLLPVAILDLDPQMSELLDLWGIRNIGEFTNLKRADLVERLGETGGQLRDRARGKSNRLLRLVRPVDNFAAATELEYEVTTTEPLIFLMRRLLETISARLRSVYLVAGRLSLRLTLADGNIYQRVFRIPEPSSNVDILLSMLQVHLENFEARAPINGLSLEAFPTKAGKHQFDLFAAGVKDPNRLSETLARVEAVLGSERFGVPRLKPTHHPDHFEMRPFRPELEPAEILPKTENLQMKRLPMRRYRPRRHVQVECHSTGYSQPLNRVQSSPAAIISGDFKGRIQEFRGPFTASGNWWEKRSYWKREEWDVKHENGRLYRLIKEQREWFVEAVG